MPSCSRIRDFIINRDAGKWRAVLTLSLSPQDVDIPGIVTAAFPGSRIESISREWKMLETSYEAVIELPGSVRCLELRKLLSILRWTVTISDSADESHAIYLHNLPHPTEDPYEVVRKHTKVGKLVNRAKSYSAFSGSRKAALELADKVEYWLTMHIRYASADLIIPAPPGNPDKAFDLPRFVADEVGGRLGLPVGLCTATGLTQPQKGVEQEIPELYSNIDGKYRAQSSLKGMTVIAMDDLYQSGATMNELVRACRAAGATTVLSLTFTKTAKFATGLTASDWYKVSMEAADTEGP